jgi:hypothetical protein
MSTWTTALVFLLAACAKKETASQSPPAPTEVTAEEIARAGAIVGELKSLVGALTAALGQGAPSAISVCHTMAPSLAASLSRDGVVVGRATRKPRNPQNEASGWQATALATFEKMHADKTQLAGTSFSIRLPDGRVAYAEPLVVQELCLACHGTNVASDVQALLAEKYPTDKATGYSAGDLRGAAWVELPAKHIQSR